MEYSEILKLLVELLGTLVGCAILTIIPKLKDWLKSKSEKEDSNNVYSLATVFVEAAEQQFKAEDPTGKLRKEYVEKCFVELGIEVTEAVNAIIEACVFRLPKA